MITLRVLGYPRCVLAKPSRLSVKAALGLIRLEVRLYPNMVGVYLNLDF